MSYQSAYFNRNQQAIRAMSDIALGQTENTVTAPVDATVFPIRYAKDLLATTPAAVANVEPQSVSQAVETEAEAAEATVAQAELASESVHHHTQSAPSPEQHQAYATTERLDATVTQDERGLAVAMWLASVVFLMIPAMLVLLNANASDYLKQQAREAINWTSTFLLGSIACSVLMLIFIGGPLQILLSIAHVIFCLLGMNAARSGTAYRVPMAWRPLQD